MLGVDAQLARSGPKQVSFHAHDVADVQLLVKREILLAHRVLANVDLQPLAVLQQMRETGLAHAADGRDASGHPHRHARLEFGGSFRAVLGQDLRNGVGEIEPLAVRSKAQAPRSPRSG